MFIRTLSDWAVRLSLVLFVLGVSSSKIRSQDEPEKDYNYTGEAPVESDGRVLRAVPPPNIRSVRAKNNDDADRRAHGQFENSIREMYRQCPLVPGTLKASLVQVAKNLRTTDFTR